MTNPFLLCIKIEKLAETLQKLDDFHSVSSGSHIERPLYLDEESIVTNVPDYMEEEEIRIEKEMKRKPKGRR